MDINRRLLAIIGQRIPAIYDVIPRGPQQAAFLQARLTETELNPQPLPPVELGAAVAAEFAHTAWLADRFGVDKKKALADLEDWCPTKPKKPKWPPGWPSAMQRRGGLNVLPPGWPNPEPPPRPPWLLEFHLGFAAQLAVASVEYEGTPLGATLNAAIDRSIEAMGSLQSM